MIGLFSSSLASGRRVVECPHCQHVRTVAPSSVGVDIPCEACGGLFGLTAHGVRALAPEHRSMSLQGVSVAGPVILAGPFEDAVERPFAASPLASPAAPRGHSFAESVRGVLTTLLIFAAAAVGTRVLLVLFESTHHAARRGLPEGTMSIAAPAEPIRPVW